MKRVNLRDIFLYCLVIFALLAAMWTLQNSNNTPEYSDAAIRQLIEGEKVDRVVVSQDNVLTLFLKEPDPVTGQAFLTHKLYSFELFYQEYHNLLVLQLELGVLSDYDYPEDPTPPFWISMLPWVVLLVVFGLMWYFMFLRQAGGGGGGGKASQFGRARTRTLADQAGPRVTFADVAGADEEKEELQEIVEFLRDPTRYVALGARIPKGVLLVGPPGTGKTLLARAVAGEAEVNFLSISGSDFVELYVGVGASRVRDLFDQAKKDSPAIVFIDEIDAVGRQRGAGLGGGHDEREQTLNQLLVEMDGFAANEGVIVLAATNRVDILDPALLRPGRFDRQVYVGLPDIKGREEILKVHSRKKPLAEDVELKNIAKATGGFTGADLENLMNEASLLAARNHRPALTMPDLDEAVLKVIAGPEKKSRVVTPLARRLTAYHEAGHAVVIHALETPDPVHQITIIPRGPAGGMTISLPQEDRSYRSKRELSESIAVCLGGRVAEALILGDISTGASNDLERATHTAREMVTKYGMSQELGTVVYSSGSDEVFIGRSVGQSRSYSEKVAAQIDQEVKSIIADAYRSCEEILSQRQDVLHKVAEYLLEYETMDAETFVQAYESGGTLPLVEATKTDET